MPHNRVVGDFVNIPWTLWSWTINKPADCVVAAAFPVPDSWGLWCSFTSSAIAHVVHYTFWQDNQGEPWVLTEVTTTKTNQPKALPVLKKLGGVLVVGSTDETNI